MFQGLPERIEKEITRLAPATMKIKVVAPPGAEVCRVDRWVNFGFTRHLPPQMVITHEEYNDAGPGIVHRKCFSTSGPFSIYSMVLFGCVDG
jgi:actin-related protein